MKPIYINKLPWKGKVYVGELYTDTDFESVSDRATQSQAVCFTKDGKIVIYEDPGGHRGMPGGTVEAGEDFEDTLKREIYEESACNVIDFGRTGYYKTWLEEDPAKITYNLRFWALVEPLEEEINDPCAPGRKRLILDKEEVIEKIGWGESGRVLIELAEKMYAKSR